MRYKIKYQVRGKVETYIAMTTSFIASLSKSAIEEYERESILLNICDVMQEYIDSTEKGLTANPKCEIDDITLSLYVYNTIGREVLLVYFERIFENGKKIEK